MGEWIAEVNIVKRVPHDGGGVMVWTGINYKCVCVCFFSYLQHVLVQLQALTLEKVSQGSGCLMSQVPQSTQGKLQS